MAALNHGYDYEGKYARKYDVLARGKTYAPDDAEEHEYHCHELAQNAIFGVRYSQLQYAVESHACEAQSLVRRKQYSSNLPLINNSILTWAPTCFYC
jgi:hypothetical protein